MSNSKFKIEGVKEIIDAFKELPLKLSTKFLRDFSRKMAKTFVVDPLKSQLPYSATTRKSFTILNDKSDPTGVYTRFKGRQHKVRWAEGGTVDRYAKKRNGKRLKTPAYRGKIQGRNIINPFVDDQVPAMEQYVQENFKRDITDIVKRKALRTKIK